MTEQEFENLIDKYLQGIASQEELKLIEAYEEFAVEKAKDKVFENKRAKKAINLEIKRNILKSTRVIRPKKQWLGIAVSIMVILVSTIWTVLFINEPSTFANETGLAIEIGLPDGSQVILNSGARLKYKHKSNGVRFVSLEGEAFFDVERDEHAPFVIETNDLQTRVLGTSFNIKSTDSLIDVSVVTGLVEVTSKLKSVHLRPNQKVSYYPQTRKMQKDTIDHSLYTSWFKPNIKLKGVRMIDLARILESRYGVRVYFKDEMAKDQKMTIAIDQNENIEEVMDNITYISQVRLTKNQKNEIKVQLKK